MKRLLPLLLLLCLLLAGCGARKTTYIAPALTAQEVTAAPLPTVPLHLYEPLRVTIDGLLMDRGYMRNGVAYLSPDTVCGYYGIASETALTDAGFTLTLPGLTVEGDLQLPYFCADGRYLYAPDGWIEADGRLYLPADAIERLFGLKVTLSTGPDRAEIGSTGYLLLSGGAGYYERTTQADDLYWLTHLIYAESHNEPLAGQIGVGNVVLNRVASRMFPDTVMSVVLDQEYTQQFLTVGTGAITAEPDETARIAAYLCLEGYNTARDSLYFANPEMGGIEWFERALTKVCVIGSHHFYK